MPTDHSPASICELCKHDKAFVPPPPLLESFGTGDVVIFAGAGTSTETKAVAPHTLYDEVAHDLKIDSSARPGFSDLMSRFCAQPDGRQKLLIKIKERFNYIAAHPELYERATKFHRELSTMYQIENIVTTNWDDYFEAECGATPFVSADDFAVWKLPGRKVFKIHGSINSLGSIVATTEDYNRCYDALSTGLIGSVLKTMLGTKTIVYVGYSFSDSDFLKIHEILTSEMKGMRPHSYIVTPDESARQRFEGKGMTPIITSGSHFLSHLKQHLLNGHMLPDSQFDGLGYILAEIEECHGEISSLHLGKHPTVILTAAYQDGLLHALKRINVRRRTGEYSHICDVSQRIKNYDELRRERLRQGRYDDVAYIDGYQNGLLLLLASETERKHVPIYYTYGVDDHPRSFRAFKRMLSRADGIHKAAFTFSQRLVRRKHMDVPGIVYHHTPFL